MPHGIQPDIKSEEASEPSLPVAALQPDSAPILCPHCGTDNSIVPDAEFCVACGESLNPAPESTPEATLHPQSSQDKSKVPNAYPLPRVLYRPPSPVRLQGSTESLAAVRPIEKPVQSIFDRVSRSDSVVLSAGFDKDSQEIVEGTSANTFIRKKVTADGIDHPPAITLQGKGLTVLRLTGGVAVFCTRGDVMKWADIHVADLGTGKIERTISSPQSAILAVAMSPNGDKLVAGGYDKQVELWDIESGTLVHSMKGHGGPVGAVAIDAEMPFAASGSRDKTLKIWNLATGGLIRTLEGHTGSVISIVITPDGSRIASGSDDCTIRVWDAGDGKLVHVLTGHKASVTALLVSPDGHHLISGSRDTTVKVWNMDTGVLLKTLAKHADTVTALAISPDETCLVTCSADRTERHWPIKEYLDEYLAREQEQEFATEGT